MANTVTQVYQGGLTVTYTTALTTGQMIAKAALHGLTQGAISKAGGGRFGDGFLGGAAGSLTEGLNLPKGARGVMAAAAIGGTVSKIGGGNFGNGAITAAFVRAFNFDGHDGEAESTKPSDGKYRNLNDAIDAQINAAETRLHDINTNEWFRQDTWDYTGKPVGGFVLEGKDGLFGLWGDPVYTLTPTNITHAAGVMDPWGGISPKNAAALVVADPRASIGPIRRHYEDISLNVKAPVYVTPRSGTTYRIELTPKGIASCSVYSGKNAGGGC
jgi:hypothetical protein